MSIPVALDEVRQRIDEFGPRAILVTVSPQREPHVVTVMVSVGEDRLTMRTGGRTRANLAVNSHVALTWPALPGGEYQLSLDGVANPVGSDDPSGPGDVAVTVERGVLHRLAGLAESGPSCLPVGI